MAGFPKGRKSGLRGREKREGRARKEGGNVFPAPFSLARGLAPKLPSPFLSNACHAGYYVIGFTHVFYNYFFSGKSLKHTRHYSSRTVWNSYSLKDWRCLRLICPERWNFGKKSRLFCCPFCRPVSLQRKGKKRKCKRDRGGGKRSLFSFSAFAISKAVSPSSYPGCRGPFSKYLISWFSNRTGTSFDDGKARGKD